MLGIYLLVAALNLAQLSGRPSAGFHLGALRLGPLRDLGGVQLAPRCLACSPGRPTAACVGSLGELAQHLLIGGRQLRPGLVTVFRHVSHQLSFWSRELDL
jgi:hypothetical protein